MKRHAIGVVYLILAVAAIPFLIVGFGMLCVNSYWQDWLRYVDKFKNE